MKLIKNIALFALLIVSASASAQTSFDSWPALKNFKGVMERVYIPAQEKEYFEPVKAWSETLMQSAATLKSQAVPAEYNNKKVEAAISELQKKSNEVHAAVVAKASNADLKKALKEAHEIYSELVKMTIEK